MSRQRPIGSYCSSAKPSGSIREWQLLHDALERCSFQPPAQRQLIGGYVVGRDRADVRRRWRNRRADDAAQHPIASLDGTGAQRRRGNRQHGAQSQKTAAVMLSDAVDPRKGLIRKVPAVIP